MTALMESQALESAERLAEALDLRDMPARRQDFEFRGSLHGLKWACAADREEGRAAAHVYFWNDTRDYSVWRVRA